MTSAPSGSTNVSPVNEEDKSEWPTIGGRCHPDAVRVIDFALLHHEDKNKKRGPFVVDAAIEKALGTLGVPTIEDALRLLESTRSAA